MRAKVFLIVSFAVPWLGACDQPAPASPQIRPVRAITVAHRVISEPLVLIGQVKAQEEISLGFRIDGKLVERSLSVGDRVAVGGLVARLDAHNEQNALQSAEADIVAAQASLAQAERLEARQAELLKRAITSRALYDQALQQLQTAQAQLESAQARLRTAENRVKYTELRAEVGGTVMAKAAEPGEFVRAGQMIVRIAREDRRDATFDVPPQLALSQRIPLDPVVEIVLVDSPNIKTTGRIREVAPQADPATRLVPVKVGLDNPQRQFFFGATVTGAIALSSPPVVALPVMAIIESDGKPAVWVIDPTSHTVALRTVEVMRYDPAAVIIAKGLQDGEMVVTAGVNTLYPGQKVKPVAGSS